MFNVYTWQNPKNGDIRALKYQQLWSCIKKSKPEDKKKSVEVHTNI